MDQPRSETLTADQLAHAVAARHKVLFNKWVLRKQRLTRAELDELRPDIGEEQYAKGIAELDQSPVGDTSLPGDYLHELKDYAKLYGRSVRQIKRWTKLGRDARPRDMPPLDRPGKMLAWWNRNIKLPPPPILEQFALDEAKGTEAEAPGALKGVDVNQLDVAEGVALKQAKRFLAATAGQLEEAYKTGNDAMIGRLQPRWEKALSAVRLAEDSERKAAERSGDLLPRVEVLSAINQLIEIMRNMQSTMSRRIRARLGVLSAELDAQLDAVIEAERSRECAVLRRCAYFGTVEDVILELDQSAGVAA